MQHSSTDKAQISFLLTDLEPQLDPRNALFRLSRARKAARRLKTIAGRVVRQLEAAVPKESRDRRWVETAKKILS